MHNVKYGLALLIYGLVSGAVFFDVILFVWVTTDNQQISVLLRESVFGAFLAQCFTDRYGRRATFFVAAIGFIVGLVIMVLSSSYTFLLLGRSFVGMGVGVGLAVRCFNTFCDAMPNPFKLIFP
jgi:MFS family permease